MVYRKAKQKVRRVYSHGKSEFTRYLNTDLGPYEKYDLYVVLWEGEKPIGHGIRYASAERVYAVEKKKRKVIKLSTRISSYSPTSFF